MNERYNFVYLIKRDAIKATKGRSEVISIKWKLNIFWNDVQSIWAKPSQANTYSITHSFIYIKPISMVRIKVTMISAAECCWFTSENEVELIRICFTPREMNWLRVDIVGLFTLILSIWMAETGPTLDAQVSRMNGNAQCYFQ